MNAERRESANESDKSSDRRSTFEVAGVPGQVRATVMTFLFIVMVSPYFGGSDLGILKVPKYPADLNHTLVYLGPILFGLSLILSLPLWRPRDTLRTSTPRTVDVDSKYRLQNVEEIVKAEAAANGLNIDGLRFGERLHINDLEQICTRTLFPDRPASEVRRVLQDARAKAFSRKYAEPKEDEKLRDVSQIKITGLKRWHVYFSDFLHELGIADLNQFDSILDVGIGNGYAEESLLGGVRSFRAADISAEALDYAKRKYPQMTSFICPAEDLRGVGNGSVDLYLSLRTYQSTLFNRRGALYEAYRVLRNGGLIVLSVPIMFLRPDGEVLKGLIPLGSVEPSMAHAQNVVDRISEYLTILNFHDVRKDERSPFEVYLSARR